MRIQTKRDVDGTWLFGEVALRLELSSGDGLEELFTHVMRKIVLFVQFPSQQFAFLKALTALTSLLNLNLAWIPF